MSVTILCHERDRPTPGEWGVFQTVIKIYADGRGFGVLDLHYEFEDADDWNAHRGMTAGQIVDDRIDDVEWFAHPGDASAAYELALR